MDTNARKKFEELEKLNAQIDVLIDEEEYDLICDQDSGILKVHEELEKPIEGCFRHDNCTFDNDQKWHALLNTAICTPIKEVQCQFNNGYKGTISFSNDRNYIDTCWSRLLYAKYLRARIMKKGTDCYFRRLDDVVIYLENCLPSINFPDRSVIKLVVFYLLELSAASLPHESLGFAQRAHMIIRERMNIPKKEVKKKEAVENNRQFSWFYDLWARYNIGVAHFHNARYRLAIQEFNYIIQEFRSLDDKGTPENEGKRKFFVSHSGYSLLYFPSVIYRADIQLKLQLAHLSLDTLHKYFQPIGEKISTHKEIRASLIRAEAHQQMDQMGESWKHLGEAVKGVSALESAHGKAIETKMLAETRDFGKPPVWTIDSYENVKGRFMDLFIEDYLNWLQHLKLKKKDVFKCARMLKGTFLNKNYLKSTRYNAYNRRGYYQQLAKLLFMLTKKYVDDGITLSESKDGVVKDDLVTVAQKLYQDNSSGLEQSEEARENFKKCRDCEWQGIDLGRLGVEHYKWFTECMLYFYSSIAEHYESKGDKGGTGEAQGRREVFVKRLINVERKYRDDLRINDLKLRYKLQDIKNKLRPKKNGLICFGELEKDQEKVNKAFASLMDCVRNNLKRKTKIFDDKEDLLDSTQYEHIMHSWLSLFKRYLECASNHPKHEEGLYFIGLQRWNSSSPAQGRSVGGGYLLYKTDKYGSVELGIAIDPGFDFLRNLFRMGFTLNDIHIILISHAHVDHIRDFESIAILLHELENQTSKRHMIHVIFSLGVYERLKHIIEDPTLRYFIEPYIIDTHREIDLDYFEKSLATYEFRFIKEDPNDRASSGDGVRYRPVLDFGKDNATYPKITISPTRAYHPDPSNYSDSFGYIIRLQLDTGNEVSLGYTGDTKWVYPELLDPFPNNRIIRRVSEQYCNCDALIAHLGSLIDFNNGKKFYDYNQCIRGGEECEKLVREKEHPYLIGLLRLLSELNSYQKMKESKQLILLGEFGEELRGGIRTDLINRLSQAYDKYLNFLPLDVGMDIKIRVKSDSHDHCYKTKPLVFCVQCEEFVDIKEADFERYGADEALYCVCRTCRKATPLNVLQDKLRQLYEVGYELKTIESA